MEPEASDESHATKCECTHGSPLLTCASSSCSARSLAAWRYGRSGARSGSPSCCLHSSSTWDVLTVAACSRMAARQASTAASTWSTVTAVAGSSVGSAARFLLRVPTIWVHSRSGEGWLASRARRAMHTAAGGGGGDGGGSKLVMAAALAGAS